MVRILLSGVVALAASLPASAQDIPVFAVDVGIVYVTATVRTEKGALVSDLTPDDFVVYEDGRPQQLTLFAPAVEKGEGAGTEALALNLGMLLDTSESMREQIKLSQESAIRFLESIPRAKDLLLIFFDQDIRLSRYTSENQQGLFERILENKGKGNTALYDAISVYLSRVADSGGARCCSSSRTATIPRARSAWSTCSTSSAAAGSPSIRSPSPAGAFGVGSRSFLNANAFLTQLADTSGGQVFAPKASKELSSVYAKILDELTNQYVLGFVSDRPERDRRFRKLRVEVKPKELKVRHRAGYFAIPWR